MASLAELESLIARVEGATDSDRELDAAICSCLEGGEVVWLSANYTMDSYPAIRRASSSHIGGFVNEHCLPLTGSIDAAVALIERVLPGWRRDAATEWMIIAGDKDLELDALKTKLAEAEERERNMRRVIRGAIEHDSDLATGLFLALAALSKEPRP